MSSGAAAVIWLSVWEEDLEGVSKEGAVGVAAGTGDAGSADVVDVWAVSSSSRGCWCASLDLLLCISTWRRLSYQHCSCYAYGQFQHLDSTLAKIGR